MSKKEADASETLVSFKDLMQAKMDRERAQNAPTKPEPVEIGNEYSSAIIPLENDDSILDAQTEIIGRPNEKNLDGKTPKTQSWAPKKDTVLGAQTSKNKNLDAQKNLKSANWVKYEKQRKTARVNLRPDAEILKKIKVYCAENDFTLTEFFEIAGRNLIDLDAQKQKDLGVKTPLDDRRKDYLFKTEPRIINLFRAYNRILNPETTWKMRDDAVAHLYNSVDIRAIELGILWTQTNYFESGLTDPPKSFKYYTGEIDKCVNQHFDDKMLFMTLDFARNAWQRITGKEIDLSFLGFSIPENEKT